VRIGFFTNVYKPRINGVVRSVSVFRQALLNLGHEVFLFAPAAPGYIDDEPNVYRYPALPWESSRLYRITIPFSPEAARLTAEIGLDVIHSQHPVLLGREAARLARRWGVPLVFTLHSQYQHYGSFLPLGGGLVNAASRFVVIRYMQACQRVVAPTTAAREQILRDAPQLADRVAVLPTPLSREAFPSQKTRALRDHYRLEGNFTFAVASRLSAEKGLSELLQAFAVLRRRRNAVRLLILGDGPEREDLETEALELRIADAVVFAGMVPFHQVAAHLQAADAFVFASQVEAQGLVLNEAMAVGLPVVAYDAPFIRDVIVDGQNGLLSKPHYRALAIKMQMLIDRPDLRRNLAEQGLVTARRYGAEDRARELVALYEEAAFQLHHDMQARNRRRLRPSGAAEHP